jgi:hypothetical protein
MRGFRWSWILGVTVGVAAGSLAACGNLVIPQNGDSNDGGDDAAVPDAPSASRGPVACDAGIPAALACTGLYSDWESLTLAPDVRPYQPGVTMWADGATSLRWIWLPPGSRIVATDPNNWVFPVGTKIWQELSLFGTRIETRFLWKEAAQGGWFRTTFAWASNLSAAPALTVGMPNARGLPYEIPAVSACEKCHSGASDFVLGFEEIGLAMPQSSGLNLRALEQMGLLMNPPAVAPVIPGDPTASGALAFLHANCGTSCHNRNNDAQAGQVGMFLKLTVDATGALPPTAQQTDTWLTSYKVPSLFTPGGYVVDAGAPVGAAADAGDSGGESESGSPTVNVTPAPPVDGRGAFLRLAPGDVAHSMIAWRTGRRDGTTQMPPIATHVVDLRDMNLLDAWVAALPP